MTALHVLRIATGRLSRALLLLVLVTTATVALMRTAPGYFSGAAELDSAHAASARLRLAGEQAQEGSVLARTRRSTLLMLQGDLGESRQYGLPVWTLLRPRIPVSALLLLRGIVLGWLLAGAGALLRNFSRPLRLLPLLVFAVLLAIPSAALATLCLLHGSGGPLLVLTLAIAARDFQFLDRLLTQTLRSPALLYARAAGLGPTRLLCAQVLPAALPQLRALITLSIVTALSALVPVEVLFDSPGVAQLAWSAAGNRDLPVLLAVTLLMAVVVLCAGAATEPARTPEPA